MWFEVLLYVIIDLQIGLCSFPCSTINECRNQILWHIPGPNPIVSPNGVNGSWANKACEVAGGIWKVNNTYYLIYHCLGKEYNIGMSMSIQSPLGPFSVPSNKPILSINTTTNAWDSNDVASFNILPNPHDNTGNQWIGYFEGGFGDKTNGKWSLGLALSNNGPYGPWIEYENNPLFPGNDTCINVKQESFDHKTCNGLYVAAVLYGEYTNNEYWMYCEAPININDEGPIQLWTSKTMNGPFIFKGYVLNIPQNNNENIWNAGKYSESRIMYFNGMYHGFMTASNVGNPHPNKIHENIGWVFSMNGLNFTENKYNAIGLWNETTPHTQAIAEGHVWFENNLIYVYHTIRWDDNNDLFAPNGRNDEDIGVEIFSVNKSFNILNIPIINENWNLNLNINAESQCLYDKIKNIYCSPIKAVIGNSANKITINPELSFDLNVNHCSGYVNASVNIYDFVNDIKTNLSAQWFLNGDCNDGIFNAVTPLQSFNSTWIIATVTNYGPNILQNITLSVNYRAT